VHRDFDLRGTATLMRTGTNTNLPQAFDLPFLVMGPWDRPFLLPDPTALIQRSGAAAPLVDAARKQAARQRPAVDEAADELDPASGTGSNAANTPPEARPGQ